MNIPMSRTSFYLYPSILDGTVLSPNGEIRQNDLNKRAPLLLQSQGMCVHGMSLHGPALHGLEAFLQLCIRGYFHQLQI